MSQQLDSKAVQLTGLRALHDLLQNSREMCTLAISCGAEDHLVQVLKKYRHWPEIRALASVELEIMDIDFVERLEDEVDDVANTLKSVTAALDKSTKLLDERIAFTKS